MAFILVSTGDTYTADLANQVVQALSGVADKGQPISLTTLDDATNYALKVKNLDTTNGRVLQLLDPAGNELLHVDKDGIHISKNLTAENAITVDGVDVGSHAHTGAAGHGVKIAETGLAAAVAAKLVTNGNSHDHVGGDGAQIPAGGLADNAVTEAKIATGAVTTNKIDNGTITGVKLAAGLITAAHLGNDIVDDTKVGNRVPQFYRRQGGSASNWNTGGTTNYTPTTVRMQAGAVNLGVIAAGAEAHVTVTFPVAFSAIPLVFCNVRDVNDGLYTVYICQPSYIGTTSCRIYAKNTDTDPHTAMAHWLAIGPE